MMRVTLHIKSFCEFWSNIPGGIAPYYVCYTYERKEPLAQAVERGPKRGFILARCRIAHYRFAMHATRK